MEAKSSAVRVAEHGGESDETRAGEAQQAKNHSSPEQRRQDAESGFRLGHLAASIRAAIKASSVGLRATTT